MRNHPAALNPRVKSLNYLNSILAKIEGTNAGCLEALMLNHKGEIAECTGDNIFIVRSNGELHTPSVDAGILEGITREAVMDLAREAGIKVVERAMDRHDVYTADEMLPDRDRRRGHPRRRVRRPTHRHRQARPDHQKDLLARFHKLVRESE